MTRVLPSGDEKLADALRIGIPTLEPFKYDSKETLGSYFLPKLATHLVQLRRRIGVLLFLSILALNSLWYLLMFNVIEQTIIPAILLVTAYFIFVSIDLLSFSFKLSGLLLSRFETQFLILNLFWLPVFVFILHTDVPTKILAIGIMVSVLCWVALIDACPSAHRKFPKMIAFILVIAMLNVFVLVFSSMPGSPGVVDAKFVFTVFDKERTLSVGNLLSEPRLEQSQNKFCRALVHKVIPFVYQTTSTIGAIRSSPVIIRCYLHEPASIVWWHSIEYFSTLEAFE